MRWIIERCVGSAQDLHDLEIGPGPVVRVNEVNESALVLGSSGLAADGARRVPIAGVPGAGTSGASSPGAVVPSVGIARRHSGGGAVWLSPGAQLWVDVLVPTDDPRHRNDIRRAAHWVGDAWSAALGTPAATWRSGMTNVEASRIACFAGVGPGEVMLGDRKLVGISQRRTRDWSRFQCVVYHRWDPEDLLDNLDLGSVPMELRSEVAHTLRSRVAVLAELGAPEPCAPDLVSEAGPVRVDDPRLQEWDTLLLERFLAALDL